MSKTKIPWTDETWPVVTGCTPCSIGCTNCYAARMAATRLKHHPRYEGLATISNGKARWTGKVNFNRDVLDQPLHWRKSKMVFVASMGDWLHPDVRDSLIYRVLDVTQRTPQHVYQFLTKRADRLPVIVKDWMLDRGLHEPPRNIWQGVSIENQAAADERIRWLLQTPAAVRFVSCEPLLSVVQLGKWLKPYKAEVQNERERNGISKSTCNRCILSGQGGSNLALPQIDSREPARFYTNGEGAGYSNTRRTEHVERLSQSDVHSEQQAVLDLRAPSRLDDCESVGYSTRVGDQPQERDTLRQQARELGASDTTGERAACRSSFEVIGQKRPEGGEKLNFQTDGATSPRDSEVMGRRKSQSNNDRENIRNFPDNDKQYCLPQDLETPPISWVICGSESGPGARPMDEDWVRDLRDQCQASGTSFFYKQKLVNGRKVSMPMLDGRTWQQFPAADGAGNRQKE